MGIAPWTTLAEQIQRGTVDNPLAEFQKLCNQRDLAAYRVVGAVDVAVSFYEAQDFLETYRILKRALSSFNEADRAVTEFHAHQPKENRPCRLSQQ